MTKETVRKIVRKTGGDETLSNTDLTYTNLLVVFKTKNFAGLEISCAKCSRYCRGTLAFRRKFATDSLDFMLTISKVSKAYGAKVLFSKASLQVNLGDRIGLAGPNGAGKSTLLKMAMRQVAPDSGEIRCQRGAVFGYLPQEMKVEGEETALERATAITEEHAALRRVVVDETGDAAELGMSIEDAHQRFQELDGYALEAKAAKMLRGLGFADSDWTKPAGALSGGWMMRSHLARLLVQEPNLLMLDEPTNHLDLPSLLWLQSYLRKYQGAILLISHDREFLNQITDSIVDVGGANLRRYRGNYDDFIEQKSAAEEQAEASYKSQQKEIHRLMTFVNRFRAKNTKARQAQSKLKQIERMEKATAPASKERTVQFSFPQPKRSGLRVIRLVGVTHSYGEVPVYCGLQFEVERGQRIGLVGPNGAGKTTLLNLLAGIEALQGGQRILGRNVEIGFYSQHRADMLAKHRTVLEEALESASAVTENYARDVLGCFLFRGDDVFKLVKVLSGGEKSRLALVKLLLNPPNLLLMDEPTTHLDIDSVEALIFALRQFEGALVFVSHDAHFLRSLAQAVIHVEDGELTQYTGEYDYYLEKRPELRQLRPASSEVNDSRPTAKASVPSSKARRRLEAQARQKRSQLLQNCRKKVETHEQRIIEIEARLVGLGEILSNKATYRDAKAAKALKREEKEKKEELKQATTEWEQAVSAYSKAVDGKKI